MYRADEAADHASRLDADILDWFKRHAKNGKGYQTDINKALRAYVAAQEKRGQEGRLDDLPKRQQRRLARMPSSLHGRHLPRPP